MLGILVCRSVVDRPLMLANCKDVLHVQHRYILVLTDTDIVKLLTCKSQADQVALDNHFDELLRELVS